MDFSLSLSPLSEPGAVYRPVSNYSLVNTETEAWKTVFCIYCSRPALLSKRMLLPPPSFLSHSLPLQQDFFFFFLHILDPTRVKESIIYNISIIIQYVVDVVHRDEMKDKSSASVSKYKV